MAEFSELIKNFEKIRDYMRDFFVYGFKPRGEFTGKSLRTYDNEKRRIEGYLSKYMRWNKTEKGKNMYISLDSAKITQNPLYSAWKSKSFTDNDIILHFYILSILSEFEPISIDELTNQICEKNEMIFDTQTVRNKANEYVNEGILRSQKIGRALYYSLSQDYFDCLEYHEALIDSVKFFQETSPLGVIGSYISDNENIENDIFSFKHHFIMHTLEDGALFQILICMKEKRFIQFDNESTRLNNKNTFSGVPLKIFVSTQTGRRYVCLHNRHTKRFTTYRLDYIKNVKPLEVCDYYNFLKEKLNSNLNCCWGVSFGGYSRPSEFKMTLYIDEAEEKYIINRLEREGRRGKTERIAENTYTFTKSIFDINECMSWVKSFTGRILSIECTPQMVKERFMDDVYRMYEMYCKEDEK